MDYFASRIGNAVLGTGGFSSRLLSRVRTEAGLAYSVSSLWTTPRRYDGLLGATTRSSGETTVQALRLILEVMESMTNAPPTDEELGTTIDEAVNGFVFNFQSPAQVVARRIAYRASGLPDDWLREYTRGIQQVTALDVLDVFDDHLRIEDMVILVVGDPEAMTEPLESLGPVTIIEVAEQERKRLKPEQYLQVKYEEFAEHPLRCLEEIQSFCGLELSSRVAAYSPSTYCPRESNETGSKPP